MAIDDSHGPTVVGVTAPTTVSIVEPTSEAGTQGASTPPTPYDSPPNTATAPQSVLRIGHCAVKWHFRHRSAAIVDSFDDAPDDRYVVTEQDALMELRAEAAARQDAESRIEAAALRARRNGASWGIIGTQLGMSRQGARQRFERFSNP